LRRTAAVLALTVAAAFATTACGSPSNTASPGGRGTLSGRVTSSPSCPVEIAGSPCPPRPLAIELVAVDASGEIAARFTSNADGRFSVELPAGSYTIKPATQSRLPSGEAKATVTAGRTTTADLALDSGIR
jgi:type 1 fimbria pilin